MVIDKSIHFIQPINCQEDNCKNTVNMVKTMSEKGVDFTAKIWQTFVSRKKNGEQGDDYDEDEDDEEEELADLEVS